MRQHDVPAGTPIDSVIAEMVKEANLHNEPVKADIQGAFEPQAVKVVARPGDDPDELYVNYKEAVAEQTDREMEDERKNLQRKADEAIERLKVLDFSDLAALIDFFDEFLEASGVTDVTFDRQTVLDAFAAHGYIEGANCGSAYDKDDRENSARWIIGQALQDIKIHGSFIRAYHEVANEWRERFAPAGASC